MILTKYLFVIIIIIIIHIITLSLSLPQIYVRFPPMITPRGAYTSCDLPRQPVKISSSKSKGRFMISMRVGEKSVNRQTNTSRVLFNSNLGM